MKNNLFLLLFSIAIFSTTAQVGIGTTEPDPSAALEIDSDSGGFLPPRMTTAKRDAISNPARGLMIYNTDEDCINFWNHAQWMSLCGEKPKFKVCGDPVIFTYNGETVTYGTVQTDTGKCWLDRDLGASRVATSKTDASAYGHLFQWGRLDDGHQKRGTVATTPTRSSSDNPGHSKFIVNDVDWRNPLNNNLWQGVNGTNNPCPDGFRLPTKVEWQAEASRWGSQNPDGAFNSPLKLTLGGDRFQSSTILGVGVRGNYWSSTINGIQLAYKLYFESSWLYADSSDYRAFGACVRCILDE